jgi:hypothetical protein
MLTSTHSAAWGLVRDLIDAAACLGVGRGFDTSIGECGVSHQVPVRVFIVRPVGKQRPIRAFEI